MRMISLYLWRCAIPKFSNPIYSAYRGVVQVPISHWDNVADYFKGHFVWWSPYFGAFENVENLFIPKSTWSCTDGTGYVLMYGSNS